MRLDLDQTVNEAMERAAARAAPLEACGLCGGRNGRATRFYELPNTDASGEHYAMRPEDQFAVIRDLRRRGLELLAIWHSHPATPARMSAEDLRLAYTPDAIYLITSLAAPGGIETRGFLVRDGAPLPVDVTVTDGPERKDAP